MIEIILEAVEVVMAQLALGVGAPHTPFFPAIAKEMGDASRMATLFKRLHREMEEAAPDLIVMFTADHFITFFFDNMPTFCIGTFQHAYGPHEISRSMPQYRIKGHPAFAKALLNYGIDQGFDLSFSEETKLDHATLVPLHFTTPKMDVPVVPIFIRALAEPLPRADRCYALGQMIRRHINQWSGRDRVAIIASGSFSLEVGGPRMGSINREWYEFVVECFRRGEIDKLIQSATSQNMLAAGNTGGELLLWIAMAGVLGASKLRFLEPDASPPDAPRDAHAYAVWDVVG